MSKIIGKQISLANQTYVDNSSLISLPTVAGTPGYTSIQNRAQILDPSKDLSVNFGVSRIPVQQIYEIPTEYGPNNERVFGVLNDDKGLIRFCGSWVQLTDAAGSRPYATVSGDFVEITFFGTGLNLVTYTDSTSRTYSYALDGGSLTTGNYPSSGSGVIGSRNYSSNVVLNVVSGLSQGIHTVKIQSTSGNNLIIFGFEVINAASQLVVNPGSAWISGASAVMSSQVTDSYNSNFTNVYGTAGTRGGHVLVYLTPDGSLKKDVQYTNTAAAYLTSADHSNEELVRTYYPREFGAARSDDFSTLPGSSSARSFVLEDGTTAMALTNGLCNIPSGAPVEGVTPATAGTDSLSFTFVGTGLDVMALNDSTSGSSVFTLFVDGVSQGTFTGPNQLAPKLIKLVSGLPYGTHTVKLAITTLNASRVYFSAFKVYQPKKPSLPSGCVELADYNVMATYSASTSDPGSINATGVLAKAATREFTYVGTWSVDASLASFCLGAPIDTSTASSYAEYTFFGTGIELLLSYGNASLNSTIQIDGSNYTGAATISVPANATWTAGTSTLTFNATGAGFAYQVTGLALGQHKVRITYSSGTGIMRVVGASIITPIHSAKSNLWADLQNTLPVGSCSLSDNRKIGSAAVDPTKKAWAQAVGILASPTTTSTILVPMQDMSVTIKCAGNMLNVAYNALVYSSSSPGSVFSQIFVDGQPVGPQRAVNTAGTLITTISDNLNIPVSPGTHKVDVFWYAGGGQTVTAWSVGRSLLVREV
jgi:hypothetical protein